MPRPLGLLGKAAGRAPLIGPIVPCTHQHRTFFMCSWIRLGSRSPFSFLLAVSEQRLFLLRLSAVISLQTVWACRFKQCQQIQREGVLEECWERRTVSPTRFCHSRLSQCQSTTRLRIEARWEFEVFRKGDPFPHHQAVESASQVRHRSPDLSSSWASCSSIQGVWTTGKATAGPQNHHYRRSTSRSRSRQAIWPHAPELA